MSEKITITAEVTIDIIPAEGQTPEQAAENMFLKFQEYVSDPTVFFREDYGASASAVEAWIASDEIDRNTVAEDHEMPNGGYEGPWVEDVTVTRLV